jgi:hypothetical protein
MTDRDDKSLRDSRPAGEQDALERRLRGLPAELPPARDLWAGIEARIRAGEAEQRPPASRPTWRPVALAASVALVAVLVTTLVRDRGPESPAPASVADTATFGPGHDLGSGYHAARAGLIDDLERRLDRLSPEARETVRENLATIRRAAAEIDAALAGDPANALLQQQLLAAYQDELTVLANMQRVTARLPIRNEI